MHKYKVGDTVEQREYYAGRRMKVVSLKDDGTYRAKVIALSPTRLEYMKLDSEIDAHLDGPHCKLFVRNKPFRDLRGRFAKKKVYRLFVREIRVVPVEIEAATLDDAETLCREGEGDYQNEKATHSDLSVDEYFHIFEREAEIVGFPVDKVK